VNKKIKLILVGHSDGGTIALLYASKFPGKVHSVITMAAHVVNEVETIRGIGPAVEAYQSGKLDKLKTYHGAKTEDLFYAWANTWQSPEFKQWNILADLGTVTVPVFAIQGEQDQYGTAKQLQLIQENVGSFCQTQMLSSCGHHPHYEQSETVKEEIKIFLTKMNFSEGKGLI
jgi:pimeloyl-ACP methyl ester carboxylesterase